MQRNETMDLVLSAMNFYCGIVIVIIIILSEEPSDVFFSMVLFVRFPYRKMETYNALHPTDRVGNVNFASDCGAVPMLS